MRLIRLPEVMHKTGLRKTSIWTKSKAGQFPAYVKIDGVTAWLEEEVDDWIKRHASARQANPTTPAP